jgi:hypothetical protein
MKKLLSLALFVLMASGCNAVDYMAQGLGNSQEVADDLAKSVGQKPDVGFEWNNGTLTAVSVTFDGIPAGTTTGEIAKLSRAAIAERFQQQPEQIIISFALDGSIL